MKNYSSYTTSIEGCQHETIVTAFEKRVRMTPETVALVYKDRCYTFKEVDLLSDQIALLLENEGVKKGSKIGLRMNRTEFFMILPLSVLKIGGIFVPIDLNWPEDQVSKIIDIAGIELLITDIENDEISKAKRLFLDISSLNNLKLCEEKITIDKQIACPDDIMCIFFTSGSTGTPKGVVHTHRSVFYMIISDCWDNALNKDDVLLYYMNFGFLFGHRIFQSIIAGVPLHIAPQEIIENFHLLNKYMEEYHVTVTIMPTQVAMLFTQSVTNKSLRILEIGGSAIPKFKTDTPYRIVSAYGSTECLSAFNLVIDKTSSVSSLGIPNRNTEYVLMDEKGTLNPSEKTGELLVSGPGIGCGYILDPQLTKEKFVTINDKTYFRTGDVVKVQDCGEFTFLYRADDMVKVHGLRIELGEITSAMMDFPEIQQVYVCVSSDNNSEHLCAYYTTLDNKKRKQEDLVLFLSSRIQTFKIPDYFIHLDSFPLSSRGKIDWNKLPKPCFNLNAYAAPLDKKEEIVAYFFAEILETDNPIGRDDSFIELGGDSLGQMILIGKLYAKGYEVNLQTVKSYPIVKDLARRISYRKTPIAAPKRNEYGYVSTTSLLKDVLQNNTVDRINNFLINDLYVFTEKADLVIIRRTLNFLLEQHMMLRSTVSGTALYIHPFRNNTNYILNCIDVKDTHSRIGIDAEIKLFHKKLDAFERGMLGVLIFHDFTCDYMYISCNHCVSDAISKKILIEDFCHVYDSLKKYGHCHDVLERNTYIDYSTCMNSLDKSDYVLLQKEYWKSVVQKLLVSPLVHIDTGSDYHTQYLYCKHSIPTEKVNDVVKSNKFFAIILTALVRTIRDYYNVKSIPMNIVHNGRDIFLPGENCKEYLSLERTIGCFPYVYPILVECGEKQASVNDILNILNAVPDNGIAYDRLKSKGEISSIHPVFCLDCIGKQKNSISDYSFIRQSILIEQKDVVETTNFQSECFIYAMLYGSKIKLFARYDTSMFNTDTIKNILVNMEEEFIAISNEDSYIHSS